jgi:hypothetical protein
MSSPPWSTRVLARIGRRGAMLVVLSVIDIVYGLAMFLTDLVFYAEPQWWPASIYSMFGLSVGIWGVVWMVVGAFLLTGIPKHIPDSIHFGAAVALWVWWAFAAMVYYFTTFSPGTWGPAAVYAGFSLLILIAAGWEDPP